MKNNYEKKIFDLYYLVVKKEEENDELRKQLKEAKEEYAKLYELVRKVVEYER